MSSINRIDQAVLLLRDRLDKLGANKATAPGGGLAGVKASGIDPLAPIRGLAQAQVSGQELRKALVRLLLAEALGQEVVGSLEFHSIADQVTEILESSEAGQDLLLRALHELR